MTEEVRTVNQTATDNGRVTEVHRTVDDPVYAHDHRQNVAARVIWFLAGIILIILAFRFVFVLLGANPSNGFANFIYNISHPLVAPFFSLFSYNYLPGVARFEIYTLVAMAVYAVIAWGLARLVTLNRHTEQVA